jgi:hypothetical protein
MLGYLLAVLIGLVLLVFLIGGLAQLRPGPSVGRKAPGDKPVQADAPAADEPTPDRSVTADASEIAAAKRHTPPA